MIATLQELNEVVNAVANRALDIVAERSTSGQRYVDHYDFSDLITREDYEKYANLIVEELNTREEILEPVVLNDGQLDINMGLAYCKAYQWIDGDEEIFGCSFEQWLEQEAKPVHHPLSLTRMAQIGEKAVEFLLDYDNYGLPLTALDLGLKPAEVKAIKNKDAVQAEYVPNEDLFLGKWRIHIADTGEKYGTHLHLVNEKTPLVEFYDMNCIDPKFCPNGQFTGGVYRVDTLLRDANDYVEYPVGLVLAEDCPEWTVSAEEMKVVLAYLHSFEKHKAGRKPTLDQMIGSTEQRASAAAPGSAIHKAQDGPQIGL